MQVPPDVGSSRCMCVGTVRLDPMLYGRSADLDIGAERCRIWVVRLGLVWNETGNWCGGGGDVGKVVRWGVFVNEVEFVGLILHWKSGMLFS